MHDSLIGYLYFFITSIVSGIRWKAEKIKGIQILERVSRRLGSRRYGWAHGMGDREAVAQASTEKGKHRE